MSATLTIAEAARLLGISRNLAYEIARREGELAGVAVIRLSRRLVLPKARLEAVLGVTDPEVSDSGIVYNIGDEQRQSGHPPSAKVAT
jgi:hypothetical protein